MRTSEAAATISKPSNLFQSGKTVTHSLADLDLRPRYVSGSDNILGDFLIPCLRVATDYRRSSGYFSSAVLSLTWNGVRELYSKGGKMRVICSPLLALSDVEALSLAVIGPSRDDQEKALMQDLDRMLSDEDLCDSARALAALIVSGFLELRIAVPTTSASESPARRIFHQKAGIFSDSSGNAVAFSGSMNETWMGVHHLGNVESIQVFASWQHEREATRVFLEAMDFEALWAGTFSGVAVHSLSEPTIEALLSINSGERAAEEIERLSQAEKSQMSQATLPYTLRPHQAEVLESWKAAGYRGVVSHATGSGKTITALHGLRMSSEATTVALILVPSRLLLSQWERELANYGPSDARILVCGDGNVQWRNPGTLEAWTGASGKFRIVLATMATAIKGEFISRVQQGSHLLVIADEAHRLGAEQAVGVLDLDVGRALALSATPNRAGDPEGTRRLMAFFRQTLTPIYGINDAIRDGVLTPYYYEPSIVELDAEEQLKWDRYSVQIARLASKSDRSTTDLEQLKKLLMKRAQIAKQAAAKVPEAVRIIVGDYKADQRWIVYCDSIRQVEDIRDELQGVGIDAYVYYSNMDGDKEATLEYFTAVGGVVVSIRCLDEGVDIPEASHALIVASSRNPREFIQRRGRVLRRFPGKDIAQIFDLLVAPNSGTKLQPGSAGPLAAEIVRAAEFGEHALNQGAVRKLESIAALYGLSFDEIRGIGFEAEDIEEGD